MRGSWWRWLSAVLAIILGLVFGWVAGIGVVHAAAAAPTVMVMADGRSVPSAVGSGAGA